MKATLHVGMGKTGTTTVQKFLSGNFIKLLASKVLYSMFLNDNAIPCLETLGPARLKHISDKEFL